MILKNESLRRTNFPKNEHFLPPDTPACAYHQGVRNVRFRKIWRALFSCNTRFEIQTSALLPTIIHPISSYSSFT